MAAFARNGSSVRLRLMLDESIPEHRAIVERLEPLSDIARSEWLRMHLYRAVKDIEPVSLKRAAAGRKGGQAKAASNGKKPTEGRGKP